MTIAELEGFTTVSTTGQRLGWLKSELERCGVPVLGVNRDPGTGLYALTVLACDEELAQIVADNLTNFRQNGPQAKKSGRRWSFPGYPLFCCVVGGVGAALLGFWQLAALVLVFVAVGGFIVAKDDQAGPLSPWGLVTIGWGVLALGVTGVMIAWILGVV